MKLRDELRPPVLDDDLVDSLVELIERIKQAEYESEEQAKLVAEFNKVTEAGEEPETFYMIESAMSIEDFARSTLSTPAPKLEITDAEYTEVIRRIMNPERTEVERDFWLDLLHRNLAHPAVSDLIYWSDLETPEEILQEARKYKPIQL
ncbi:MAG: hypothetical protein ACQEVA_01285 [Myxococcota bacterium]